MGTREKWNEAVKNETETAEKETRLLKMKQKSKENSRNVEQNFLKVKQNSEEVLFSVTFNHDCR